MRTLDVLRSSLATAALALFGCGDGGSSPGGRQLASTTHLVQYQTCAALEADLKAMLIAEADAMIDRIGTDFGWPPGEDAAAGGDSSGGGDRQEGVDYSGTNNQEDGVDEADLVKTDGYHIYTLNGNRLHIFGVPAFGDLVPESVTELEGHPTQLLVDRDAEKATVFSIVDVSQLPAEHPLRELVGEDTDEYGWYWRSSSLTKITVLDISDRTQPALVREVFFEGWYQTARETEGSVRLAAYSSIDVPALWRVWDWYYQSGENKAYARNRARTSIQALELADFIPQLYVRTPDGSFTTSSLSTGSCQSFYRPSDSHARGVASIISFDLFGDTVDFDADHVISSWATFYASTDTLVLAEAAHDWWWYWWWHDDPEHLNVHAFDISQPGETTYLASGRVQGWLFDPFSIDEENGTIRLATTTDMWRRWWVEEPPPSDNHVFVLQRQGDQLVTVGHLDGIATGERITAARLLGDRGFLVTFEQIDPLWTLDLSDPTDPRIVGELEVPGFSTYLHPLGDKLLSIGVGGDENGANWKTQISLFDVSDFASPTLAASLPLDLGDEWGWSEALWEHKAFQYWGPKQLLAVPQATYRAVGTTPEGWTDYRYLSRLELVTVDADAGTLARKGAIDHSAYYNADGDHPWYWAYVDIRRSIFMGDYVYALSDKAITVHRTSDLGQVAVAELPGYGPDDYYWWW